MKFLEFPVLAIYTCTSGRDSLEFTGTNDAKTKEQFRAAAMS